LHFGESMDAARARTYARLLDRGVIPTLPVEQGESSGEYLGRVFDHLAQQYDDVPFSLTIAPYARLVSDFGYDAHEDDDLMERCPVSVLVHVADAYHMVDASQFDAEVARYDRSLAAWLVDHVRTASFGTFDAYTAGTAYEYAEWGILNGSPGDWWEMIRHDVAHDLGIKAQRVTWAQMRKHVRDNELRSPGMIRCQLGHHHANLHKKRLSLDMCASLVVGLPARLRKRAQLVVEQTAVLEGVSTRMRERSRKSELRLLGAFGAPLATPGLVLETSAHGMVVELLNDEFDYVSQDTGFGPNYALILDATDRSAERLRATLEDLHTASIAVGKIAEAMSLPEKGTSHR
jgi:hypothetical protein